MPSLFAKPCVSGILLAIYFQNYFTSTNIDIQVVSEQLGCQPHALEVGIQQLCENTLTPDAGLWLIYSAHFNYPLKDLHIAAWLFPLADDLLVSASMHTAGYLKHDTPQSRAVANFLLLKIKTMAEEKRLTTPVCSVDMKNRGSG